MRLLKWVLLACLVALLLSSADAKKKKGKKKLKKAKEPKEVDPLACDICQTMVYVIHDDVKPAIKHKKAHVKKTQGDLPGKVAGWQDPQKLCAKVAEFKERFQKEEEPLWKACLALFDDVEAGIEELFVAGVQESAVASDLCLNARICPDGALWSQPQHISNRESPKEKNEREGQAYLDANLRKPSVKVTQSGLQYEILAEGDEAERDYYPEDTSKVKVHYKGTLVDGTEFDASGDEPTEFQVDGVIPGWTEGLKLMSKGDKFRFVIPDHMAYGAQGSGAKIGPAATLIFEVELVEFETEVEEDEEEEEDMAFDDDHDEL